MNEFSFILGLGGSLALLRLAQSAPRDQVSRHSNAGLLILFSCLVGARLVYVLLRGHYYFSNLAEAFQFWRGGLSMPGAVAGSLVGLLLVSFIERQSPLRICDAMVPLVAPVVVAVWLACWQAGCAYGDSTPDGTWWGIPVRDESGVIDQRWPLQPLAALTIVLFFWLVEAKIAVNVKVTGWVAGIALLGLGLNLLIFSYLRVDPAFLWYGHRLDIWAATGLCLIGLISVIISSVLHRREA